MGPCLRTPKTDPFLLLPFYCQPFKLGLVPFSWELPFHNTFSVKHVLWDIFAFDLLYPPIQGIYNCTVANHNADSQAVTAAYVIYAVGDALFLRGIPGNADRNLPTKYKEKLMGISAKHQAPKRLEQWSHQKQQHSVLLLLIQRLRRGRVGKNETKSIWETLSQSKKNQLGVRVLKAKFNKLMYACQIKIQNYN